jgi:nicotinate-nucleotide pyrophosphorylase (carboxylating)
MAFREDLGSRGDITTQATISPSQKITARLVARQNGVVAGIDLAQFIFEEMDDTLEFFQHVKDGDPVFKGGRILTVKGRAQSILQAERIALNFLTHLSGIATQTAQYVQAVAHTQAKILDTRKTLPGYRELQKYAVKTGGGENHRMGLHDMILVKDNHIAAAGGVKKALDKVKAANPETKVEIEVDTLEQFGEVIAHGGADIVMLDNMSITRMAQAAKLAKGKIKTEASGGVTLESVREIAETGVDYISIGALTHTVPNFDIGLDFE